MSSKIIFILSVASLFAAGSGFAATNQQSQQQHHRHGYHAYAQGQGKGQGYKSTCARFNNKLASEPGAEAIQDQDYAQSIGGRKGTCH